MRRRVRALYKLSSGGYLRLLSGAASATEIGARDQAARRILMRDLDELQAVHEEAQTLDALQGQKADEIGRALTLAESLSCAAGAPTGLAAQKGQLGRPVAGALAGAFGVYRDAALKLELSRRGVELTSRPGESVRAIADGEVRWVGDVPGLGRGVVVDHGDEYLTLTARLERVELDVGAHVAAGARLGSAAGPTVYLELAVAGTAIDPAPWLTPAAP
jgi:septal ring factor EnvC (AmiA/AmiB activator)